MRPPAILFRSPPGPPSANRKSLRSGIRLVASRRSFRGRRSPRDSPGSMYSVPVPTFASHFRSSSATNCSTICKANLFRDPSVQHHIRQRFDHFVPSHLIAAKSLNTATVLVNQRQHAPRPAIMHHGDHEIVTPPHRSLVPGRSRRHDPWFNHNLPRGLCFCGTFNLSHHPRSVALNPCLHANHNPAAER